MSELISIVVPVFNTEKYLEKCLGSICGQTYKNLEIILVDDGSTDKSGAICDEFSMKDNRIIVIHKENKGVSEARNKGLSIARGDFIGFVDSDDWIDCDMYRILHKEIKNNKAEISICGYYEVFDNELRSFYTDKTILYNRCKAMEELVNEHSFKDYLCNKLFRRELFDTVEFPIGRTMEDKAIMYKVFDQSKTIVYLNKILYYYRKHPDSITGSIIFTNRYGNYKAESERYIYLSKKYPTLENILFLKLINSSLMFCRMACFEIKNKILKSELSDIRTLYRKNIKKIIKSDTRKLNKILTLVFICSNKLFKYYVKIENNK